MTSGHSGKSVWLCIFLIALAKGNYCLNSTQTEGLEPVFNNTVTEKGVRHTEKSENKGAGAQTPHSESSAVNTSEPTREQHTSTASTKLADCVERPGNDTHKTNYSLAAEAAEALDPEAPFRLPKSAAIGAGIFLVSAVLGYLSCVSYRRFLQRKYGNSQMINAEEVYDTTDLRYFEI